MRVAYLLLLLFPSFMCCNRAPVKDEVAGINLVDSSVSFNLDENKHLFWFKNHTNIPEHYELDSLTRIDSISLGWLYNDTISHYYHFDDEPWIGNFYYSYVDTFPQFNLITILTAMGDGGNVYDLITLSKQGHPISKIEAGYEQGKKPNGQQV